MNRRRSKVPRGDQGLIAHVRRAEAGKVPFTQYCQENGVNVQSLYNLRSRLTRTGNLPRQALRKKRKPVTPFVALRVAAAGTPASSACRLQAKGWVIECAHLPPSAWLAGLMAGDAHAVP